MEWQKESVSLYKEMGYLNSFPNLRKAKHLPTSPYPCMDFHWHHWTVEVIVCTTRFICRLWARVHVYWAVWFAVFVWETFQCWNWTSLLSPQKFSFLILLQLNFWWKMPKRTRFSQSHTLWGKTLVLSDACWNVAMYRKSYMNKNN